MKHKKKMIHLFLFILFFEQKLSSKKFFSSLSNNHSDTKERERKKMIFSFTRENKNNKNDIFSNHFHLFLTKPENQDTLSDIPISHLINQSN